MGVDNFDLDTSSVSSNVNYVDGFKKQAENLLNNDFKKMFLSLVESNKEILLPSFFGGPEVDVDTTFYFSQDKQKSITFSRVLKKTLSVPNIMMQGEGFKAMIFIITYGIRYKVDKIKLRPYSLDGAHSFQELVDFYKIFGFEQGENKTMFLSLKDENFQKLYNLVMEYIRKKKLEN